MTPLRKMGFLKVRCFHPGEVVLSSLERLQLLRKQHFWSFKSKYSGF